MVFIVARLLAARCALSGNHHVVIFPFDVGSDCDDSCKFALIWTKNKAKFGPFEIVSVSHARCLCASCVCLDKSQKGDLIATVLAGKLIPQHAA